MAATAAHKAHTTSVSDSISGLDTFPLCVEFRHFSSGGICMAQGGSGHYIVSRGNWTFWSSKI